MKLHSDSFKDGEAIPGRYAFAVIGDPVALSSNQNPHLAWSDVPAGTQSFAILMIDPDVPSVGDDVNQAGKQVSAELPRVEFSHWLLANLPASVQSIGAGTFSDGIKARGKPAEGPFNSVQGLNDYTSWFADDADMSGQYHGYDGPCPPWNDQRMHHYTFTVYALDSAHIELPAHFGADQLLSAIAPHVLAKASLTGRYTLNPAVSY
ncbi:MAG: YbhB/YbcL family Raf kinase inhibitor-like protein [Arenimonas sp.]|nr:YbhB/YbcL family Raf kinase inhibitor-like protein [Arenimonas sp.]